MDKTIEMKKFIEYKFAIYFFNRLKKETEKSDDFCAKSAACRSRIRSRNLIRKIKEVTGDEITDFSLDFDFDCGHFRGIVTGTDGKACVSTYNYDDRVLTSVTEIV